MRCPFSPHRFGGSSGDDVAEHVATDPFGNILVAGEFSSATITIGTTTLTRSGGAFNDVFVTKLDALGNPLWAYG